MDDGSTEKQWFKKPHSKEHKITYSAFRIQAVGKY